nr:hypothetical protein [uncultured Sphingomonas sp.]
MEHFSTDIVQLSPNEIEEIDGGVGVLLALAAIALGAAIYLAEDYVNG